MVDRALARRAALVSIVVLVTFGPVVGGAIASSGATAPRGVDAASGATAAVSATPTPARSTETPTQSSNGTATADPNGTATRTPTPSPNETATPTDTATPTPDGNGTPTPDGNETPTPPGMETDPIGWEGGFWYNDSLPIDRSDGLNRTELEAVVSRAMARVEEIRNLEYDRTVPVRLRSRGSYRRAVRNRTVNESLRTFDNAKFEALFLVEEFRDSIAVLGENSVASLLGYYDPRNGSIVLLVEEKNRSTGPPITRASGRALPTVQPEDDTGVRIDERVLAHELHHALQDQQFDLERFVGETRDDANAMDALVEGDASLVERRYAHRCEGAWSGSCLTTAESDDGSLANTGVYLVTYQPYSDGPKFVRAFYRRGGWAAVNDLYERPPASTEQVIHPERYPGDEPTNVSLADETGTGWQRVRPPGRPDYAELGEAAIVAGFVYPLYDSSGRVGIVPPESFYNQSEDGGLSEFDPFEYDQPYSDGWDGDRLHVYENGTGETGYVWRIAWDSPAEATEFYRGYRQLLAYWGAVRVGEDTYRIDERGFEDAFHVAVNGSTVTIVNAPDVWSLRGVRTGLGAEIDGSRSTETMTLPDDARLDVPSQPGFGAAAAVLALLIFGYGRLR